MTTFLFIVFLIWLWDTFVRHAPWWQQLIEWLIAALLGLIVWGLWLVFKAAVRHAA